MSIIDEIEAKVTHFDEVNVAINAFESMLDGKYVVYLSTPITTGLESFKNKNRDEVIEINKTHAYKFEKFVQAQDYYGTDPFKTIINPTTFYIDHWTQYDYLYMWKEIIERYVSEIIFNKNWQYSNGCCFEYLVAMKQNNIVLRHVNELIYDNHFEKSGAIFDAIQHMKSIGADTSFIESIREELNGVN